MPGFVQKCVAELSSSDPRYDDFDVDDLSAAQLHLTHYAQGEGGGIRVFREICRGSRSLGLQEVTGYCIN